MNDDAHIQTYESGTFIQGDCLELMNDIPNGSIDLILCDPPFGITDAKWDVEIPLDKLWEHYWRVLKPSGVVLLFSQQPFTTAVINSQTNQFKYLWYWKKSHPVGFLQAKLRPLNVIEDVCVFYKRKPTYNPQGVIPIRKKMRNGNKAGSLLTPRGKSGNPDHYHIQLETNYPTQLLEFKSVRNGIHPTQKPVQLFEYLIRTYTNQGETVLDNTAGSCTTAIAADNANRKWICIEQDQEIYAKASARLQKHFDVPLLDRILNRLRNVG